MKFPTSLRKRIQFGLSPTIALLWVGTVFGQTNISALAPNCVSIYQVPLVCPAAPQIGCGSRAKPILEAFEHQALVESAWLNHSGTVLAIVWKSEAKKKERSSVLKSVCKSHGLDARELKGNERKEALADFSGGSWLRGADVDRLSEEEAAIMAGRLIHKIRGLVAITDEKAKILRDDFTEILKRRLTGELADRESAQEELVQVLRRQMSDQDVRYLQQALKDYRPGQDDE